MSKNISELSGKKGLSENLFTRYGELAIETGTPSVEELDRLAKEFLIGKANTYGAVTFYDFLRPENQNKKVYVCNGTACLCAGTQEAVVEQLRKHFSPEEIGHMTCLGRCHENKAFHFRAKNYSGAAISKLDSILEGSEKGGPDKYRVAASGRAILTRPFPGMEALYSPFLAALKHDPEEALARVKASGVRGRGGAGFPMGLKLEACRREESDTKFIICNADEGDPGAYSDRYLLEERPHSVLFGMLVAGYITGANQGVVYIRGEYPESVAAIEQAIAELSEAGLIGRDIQGSGYDFDLRIIKAQGAYICGEESALINSIEGQRPEVRIRPPYPTQKGLFNRPTVVNNVETLATLPFILEPGGAAAWRALGTASSFGTKLICLDSLFVDPGLYEVEMGTPLSTVVYELGGGFKRPVKALQIGGPLGGLVPIAKVPELTVDFESFAEKGFLLGHASVVSVPEDFPMLKYIEHLFDFAAYESCGKCFPCRLGTKRGQEMAAKALTSDYKIDRKLLEDLLDTLEKGSLCAHGGGIPLPVRNALHYFEEELQEYIV